MTIHFVGALPPPLHGASMANRAVLAALREKSDAVQVYNTAATTLKRGIWRLARLRIVLIALIRFVGNARLHDSLYISIAGGVGQLYDLGFVILGRIALNRIILHHHSYSYINCHNKLSSFLFKVAGRKAMHVTLSEQMGEHLALLYSLRGTNIAISNGAYLDVNPSKSGLGHKLNTIGFISNISFEKGIISVARLVKKCEERGFELSFKVAGPCQDAAAENYVKRELLNSSCVSYVGPVYGSDKQAFFQQIDLLIFPTEYKNEAEPIVILEALQYGIPVLASSRGCISELLRDGVGLVAPVDEDFASWALQQIEYLRKHQDAYNEYSIRAHKRFIEIKIQSEQALAKLISYLMEK